MKKIILFVMVILSNNLVAQISSVNGVNVAQKIAKKMKDSLNLTGQQKNKVYTVNVDLHIKKQQARNETLNNMPLLTQKIQIIEKTRDSLYQPILTPPQFILYKQKKRNLISNN